MIAKAWPAPATVEMSRSSRKAEAGATVFWAGAAARVMPAVELLSVPVLTMKPVNAPLEFTDSRTEAKSMLVPSAVASTPVSPILALMAATILPVTTAPVSPMAISTSSMATALPRLSVTEMPVIVAAAVAVPVAAPASASASNTAPPSAAACALAVLPMLIAWPAFAPTWNSWPRNEPSSSLVPLNSACFATRSTSSTSCATSAFRASRSLWLLVAFADCTASSRMRCRFVPTSPRAPSAVCAREMASLALRTATFKPRIWVVKRSEIARPAASSRALLMRRPEDSRWIVVASVALLVERLRCAFSEIVLVLMTLMAGSPGRVVTPVRRGAVRGRGGGPWPGSPRCCDQ